MPPPRKVDKLPPDIRAWLNELLKVRGFGDYEEIADALNARLIAEGVNLQIQKSAIHAYGKEYQAYVKLQEESSAWAKGFIEDAGIAGEAEQHGALFQMLNTLAFKAMRGMVEGEDVGPKDLSLIAKMLKDMMASTGIREKVLADERNAMAARVEEVAQSRGLGADTVKAIRHAVLGVDDAQGAQA